jgi:drug/metabolite transporter (DMT)-like permease
MQAIARPARGIALLLLATVFFVLLDATAKHLARQWPVPLLVWVRYTTHCALMVLLLGPRLGHRLLATGQPVRQVVRALLLLATTLCIMTALGHMPLAETTAVAFAAPVIVVILARPLLGEKIGPLRWLAVLIGFAGVLLIARPGSGLSATGLAWAGSGAVFLALYQILTRQLSAGENPLTMLFYTALVGTLAMTPWLPWVWTGPRPEGIEWALVLGMGVFGGTGHFLLIRAFREAPASLLAPITYAQIPMAVLLGWVVFHHTPAPGVFLGMLVIAGAGVLLAWDSRPRQII